MDELHYRLPVFFSNNQIMLHEMNQWIKMPAILISRFYRLHWLWGYPQWWKARNIILDIAIWCHRCKNQIWPALSGRGLHHSSPAFESFSIFQCTADHDHQEHPKTTKHFIHPQGPSVLHWSPTEIFPPSHRYRSMPATHGAAWGNMLIPRPDPKGRKYGGGRKPPHTLGSWICMNLANFCILCMTVIDSFFCHDDHQMISVSSASHSSLS